MTETEKYLDYLMMLRRPFQKLCRLRFLNPDGTTAYMIDNNPYNKRGKTFIAEGSLSMNWGNGQRRSASARLDNINDEYTYQLGKLWFGTEIALDEGLVLSDGTDYYIQQGVFVIEEPEEALRSADKTTTLKLSDKAAVLDGTLGGNLEASYEVPIGTNIFTPITALLAEDRGNGVPWDNVKPIFTEYYNNRYQTLPNGLDEVMTSSPFTFRVDGENGTRWQVIEGLADMVNAWVGYDQSGALRIDPSQDDILDAEKPVLWRFSLEEAQFLGASYRVKNKDVYNDFIVVGEQMSDYSQPKGRAQNLDLRSPTNVQTIGRKTKRINASGYGTDQMCIDRAVWELKHASVLQRSVSISCTQIFHIDGNDIVEIVRTDKPGNPVERHLIQGFSRPLAWAGEMTIEAVSVQDFPNATVTDVDS